MRTIRRLSVAFVCGVVFAAVGSASAQQPQGWTAEPAGAFPQMPPASSMEFASGPYAGDPISTAPISSASVLHQPIEQAGYEIAAHELDALHAPPSLEQQLAGMSKRLEALEKPPIKYPANVQMLGVFQTDAVMFNQDAANKLPIAQGGVMTPNQPAGVTTIQNGADFRRARLAGKAALANNINAFMQFDFAFPGRPTFTDLWIDYTDIPFLGTVRIGQWKQPFSLEVVSSFRYTTFMERSSLFIPFTPFRHLGVGAYNHAEDLTGTWAASYFRTGQDQSAGSLSTRGGNGFAGRVTRLGWYDEDAGRSYLHLGGDYYFNSPPQRSIIFRTPPEIFVGETAANGGAGTAGFQAPGTFNGTPFFANTGTLTDVHGVHTFDLEMLWVHGPLSVQSEAMAAQVNRENNPSSLLHGEYVQVGYFLTGEHRPYDRVFGVIDRVRPFEDFFWVRTAEGSHQHGKGAWEVAVRFSHLDLEDNNVSGGILNDITFGVNWYTNPFTKIVFNYIHAWRQSPTSPPSPAGNGPALAVNSEANAFGLRAQMDF